MSLIEIKQYLMQVKVASLSHLSAYFKCDAETLRQMLCHWLRKGCVRQFKKTAACGSACQQCIPAITEMYEWVYTK